MKKLTTEHWVQQAIEIHGDRFNYTNTVYSTAKTKLKIICSIHGEQEMLPHHHLRGTGCGICGKAQINISNGSQLTQAAFIMRGRAISENLSFEKTVYKSKREEVVITCKIHGDYITKAEMILKGCGCPKCTVSKGEQEIEKWLISKGINYVIQKTFKGLYFERHLKFDFYLPDYNVCIEYDGKQHFKPVEYWGGEWSLTELQIKDNLKNNYCKDKKIELIRINYTENIKRKLDWSIVINNK